MREAAAADLAALIAAVEQDLPRRSAGSHGAAGAAILYLVAATSHLAEGWRERVPRLELGGSPGAAPALAEVVRRAGPSCGVPVVWESPADVIPLPGGWEERARPVPRDFRAPGGALTVLHFDPYSVVLRLVARGDERDYLAALQYLQRGWVEMGELERMLGEVLPRCTSETLAQDPAEFRRKFRGLRQVAVMNAALRRPDDNPDNLDRVSRGLHTRPSISDA